MVASASLDGGAAYTTDTVVSASLAAPGATHMRWRIDGGAPNTWRAFATPVDVTLPAGDGAKSVTFEFSADGANVAASAADSITLHTTVPSVALGTPSDSLHGRDRSDRDLWHRRRRGWFSVRRARAHT